MKLPILILIAGTMGVAQALPNIPPRQTKPKEMVVPVSPARMKRVVTADTERGAVREISLLSEPQVEDEDFDDSSFTLTDEAQAQADYAQWAWGIVEKQPDLFSEDVSTGSIIIDVNKSTQRGRIIISGKEVTSFKLSTGLPRTPTPSGSFRPGAHKRNWRSGFASRKYGRSIFLKDAVQISGGAFMHAASTGAMNYLGQKRSAGCVRVPPAVARKVIGLVESNKRAVVFRVH